jgi:predicted nucleic acid-binding protein
VIVVIDTNVWISALQFAKRRGTPTLALEKAMSEDVIASCDEIDAEILPVLTKKFSWELSGWKKGTRRRAEHLSLL